MKIKLLFYIGITLKPLPLWPVQVVAANELVGEQLAGRLHQPELLARPDSAQEAARGVVQVGVVHGAHNKGVGGPRQDESVLVLLLEPLDGFVFGGDLLDVLQCNYIQIFFI